jgi:hypothetical protein
VRWRQLRAGLIALAIAFGLIDGLPLPAPEDTPAWEAGFVEPVRHVQHTLMWPVRWVGPLLRIGQRWALYQAPGKSPWRMWIEGRAWSGRWVIVYRAGDPDHTEDSDILDYGRIRGVWEVTSEAPAQFGAFADWITARVLDRHPEFSGVRVRMEKVRLTSDGVEMLGQFAHIHIRDRGGPR